MFEGGDVAFGHRGEVLLELALVLDGTCGDGVAGDTALKIAGHFLCVLVEVGEVGDDDGVGDGSDGDNAAAVVGADGVEKGTYHLEFRLHTVDLVVGGDAGGDVSFAHGGGGDYIVAAAVVGHG